MPNSERRTIPPYRVYGNKPRLSAPVCYPLLYGPSKVNTFSNKEGFATYHMFDFGIYHGGPRCSIASNRPSKKNNILRLEAKTLYRILHHCIYCILLLTRKRNTLHNTGKDILVQTAHMAQNQFLIAAIFSEASYQ